MADFLTGLGRLEAEAQAATTLASPMATFMADSGNAFLDVMRGNIDNDGINANFLMRQGLDIRTTDAIIDFTSEQDYTLMRNEGVSGTETQRDTSFSFKAERPSQAMVEDIDNWMRAKGFTANPWAVATNVLKHGYEGARFIEKTFTHPNLDSFENALLSLVAANATGKLERIIPQFK